MTDYRKLSEFDQKKVDEEIRRLVEPGTHTNLQTGWSWEEPQSTLFMVHSGDYCATCFNIFYNCVCGHDG